MLVERVDLVWRDRAGANYFRLVRPLHALLSVNKVGGSVGMLPQENFLN